MSYPVTATLKAESIPWSKANFLASPPLVVAYALAGNTNVDLTTEPLGLDKDGQPVYLNDISADQRPSGSLCR